MFTPEQRRIWMLNHEIYPRRRTIATTWKRCIVFAIIATIIATTIVTIIATTIAITWRKCIVFAIGEHTWYSFKVEFWAQQQRSILPPDHWIITRFWNKKNQQKYQSCVGLEALRDTSVWKSFLQCLASPGQKVVNPFCAIVRSSVQINSLLLQPLLWVTMVMYSF